LIDQKERENTQDISGIQEQIGISQLEIDPFMRCSTSQHINRDLSITDSEINDKSLEKFIKTVLLEQLSKSLKVSKDSIDNNVAFSDYGVDSIIGVSFVKQVNDVLGVNMNSAILFDYTTVDRLTIYIIKAYRQQLEKNMLFSPKKRVLQESIENVNGVVREKVKNNLFDDKKQDINVSEITDKKLGKFIKTVLLDQLSKSLKVSEDSIDNSVAFSDYGVDSIIGVSFVKQVNDVLGVNMNSAVLFDYTTVNRLTSYLIKAHKQQIKMLLSLKSTVPQDYVKNIDSLFKSTSKIGNDNYTHDDKLLKDLEKQFLADDISTELLLEMLSKKVIGGLQ
jgi:acyl carrier protein